jgi:hypothetical protein
MDASTVKWITLDPYSDFSESNQKLYTNGCKLSKVDQESAPVYGGHDFLGQTPISSRKMLFKLFFS